MVEDTFSLVQVHEGFPNPKISCSLGNITTVYKYVELQRNKELNIKLNQFITGHVIRYIWIL